MAVSYPEPFLVAKDRLLGAIRACARQAAEFEVSALNIDRPIAATPWLRDRRYGNDEYDARWYAVMAAKDHFNERIAVAVENELSTLFAIAYMAGQEESNG
jgi:type IV secretory pathway VirD2 relaxase